MPDPVPSRHRRDSGHRRRASCGFILGAALESKDARYKVRTAEDGGGIAEVDARPPELILLE